MKKKLLAIILCAVMIMTALPVVVMPAVADGGCAHTYVSWTYEDGTPWVQTETKANKKMTCNDCGDEIIFKPQNCKPWQAGNVYLTEDSTSDDWYGNVTEAKVIHFDLNGHTLTAGTNLSAIRTHSNYTFNLYDSQGTGKVLATASGSKAISVIAGHTLNVYSGNIFGTVSNSGTLNMYGGHTYDDLCDATCNVSDCGYTREAEHTYSGDCDINCNLCNATREVSTEHTYTNEYDVNCDVCGFERVAKPCCHTDATWTEESTGAAWTAASTGNKVMTCSVCATSIAFKPWTSSSELLPWYTTNIYLTTDITSANGWLDPDVTLNLDLNGYTVSVASGKYALDLNGAHTVSIYDSVGDGMITKGASSLPAIKIGGTSKLNMYGGKIAGFNHEQDGGAIYMTGSKPTFNMYGGEISGNTTSGAGGAISCWTGAWNSANDRIAIAIYGGKIINNTSTRAAGTGGAINMAQLNGSVLVAGGEIYGNSAADHNGICGGGTAGGLTVTGGYVDYIGNFGEGTADTADDKPVAISGGIFKQDYSAWVAEGLISFNVGDGTYRVEKENDSITAAVRLRGNNADESGIKFRAVFADGVKDTATEFGIIIISKAKYDTLATKDFATLAANGYRAVADTTGDVNEDGTYTVNYTVFNIASANYADDIVVVKYIDGELVSGISVRSVKTVAELALADTEAGYTAEETAILNAFAGVEAE